MNRLSNRLGPRKALAILLGIVLVATGVGAVVVLLQRLPPVAVASVEPGCESLVSSPESVPVGSSGFVLFFCEDPGGAVPAFDAPAGAVLAPTFTLPAPWVTLAIYEASETVGSGQTCAVAIQASSQLTSGVGFTFPTDRSSAWSYCSDYVDASGSMLPAIDVAWNVDTSPGEHLTVVRFEFPSPCESYVEARHTGQPGSMEFWIYAEEGNTHDLEGWAIFTPDGAIILSFDLGVAAPPAGGTQTGAFQFYVTHPGLEWPEDMEMQLFCN